DAALPAGGIPHILDAHNIRSLPGKCVAPLPRQGDVRHLVSVLLEQSTKLGLSRQLELEHAYEENVNGLLQSRCGVPRFYDRPGCIGRRAGRLVASPDSISEQRAR